MHPVVHTPGLRRYVASCVHPDAAGDGPQRDRHARFLIGCATGAVGALVLLAVLAATGPAPSLALALTAVWVVVPLVLAGFVSRTGRLQAARMAALTLAAGTLALASASVGLGWLAFVWLCVLPLEMGLAGGARDILNGLYAAGAGLVGLVAYAFARDVPELVATLAAWGVVVPLGTAYACLLAWRFELRRRDARAREAAEQNRFRVLAAHSSDLITCHGLDGETLFASQAATTLLGCDPESLRGAGLFARVHIHDRVAFRKALADAAARMGETVCEFRVADATGHRWLEMRCRPVTGADGAVCDVVGVSRDVSAAHERADALEAERRRMEDASEAKSRFLAVVSHELRTPLNAIIGFSDLIRTLDDGTMPVAKRREYVDLIHEAGTHLLRLVSDLLDMSKIEAGRYDLTVEPFDCAAALKSCAAMMRQVAGARGIAIDIACDDGAVLEADPRAFAQVLINLVTNAVKFSRDGASVRVALARRGETMVLDVRDDGQGIAPGDVERLCQPFTQACAGTARAHEGAGLGLSIVKGLVELHGGTLAIASELGRGTTVSVTLPLRHRPAAAEQPRIIALEPLLAAKANPPAIPADEPQRRREHGRVSA